MADFYWIGPDNGFWSTVGNWSSTSWGPSNGAIPGPNDNVYFTGDTQIQLTGSSIVDQPFTIKNLTFSTGNCLATGPCPFYQGICTIYSAVGYDYPLVITDTLDIGSPYTNFSPGRIVRQRVFDGTAGWQTDKLINSGGDGTITLKAGVKYKIMSSFIDLLGFPRRGFPAYNSSDTVEKTKLILNNPSICNVLANFTRIDASEGRSIVTWFPVNAGTVTQSTNVFQFRNNNIYENGTFIGKITLAGS